MAEEVLGIKETKEALIGVNELAIEIVKHAKDGIQASDAVAILDDFKNNPELKAALEAAIENIKGVPAEVSDMSLKEGIELAIVQVSYAPKIIEALK